MRMGMGGGVAMAAGLASLLGTSAPAAAQVYVYKATIGTTGVAGSDASHFNNPFGGSVDTVHGHYFVADVMNQRVQVYSTSTLQLVDTIGVTGVRGTDNEHFNEPGDVGFSERENRLFIPDVMNQRVQVFDAGTLAYVATIGVTGVSGTDNVHFNGPISSRVNDTAHQVYITDFFNSRVQIYDATTLSYIATLGVSGAAGSDNAHFDQMEDAEYNPLNNQIMVADQSNERVQIFDATTFAYVQTLGGPAATTPTNMPFTGPVSAAFDPVTNLVLIADDGPNDRVQVLDGKNYSVDVTLGTTGVEGPGNNQFPDYALSSSDPI
jgi:DNA-binding beta-propeller fold protein YncE